jgi:hypothetical protein
MRIGIGRATSQACPEVPMLCSEHGVLRRFFLLLAVEARVHLCTSHSRKEGAESLDLGYESYARRPRLGSQKFRRPE